RCSAGATGPREDPFVRNISPSDQETRTGASDASHPALVAPAYAAHGIRRGLRAGDPCDLIATSDRSQEPDSLCVRLPVAIKSTSRGLGCAGSGAACAARCVTTR